MPTTEIVPATIAHVYQLARNLRAEDRAEVEVAGEPRRVLRDHFRTSIIKKTGLLDGKVAVMWGMAGPLIAQEGEIWLLTAPLVEKLPLTYGIGVKREMDELFKIRARLSGFVAASYDRAVRLLEVLRFELGEPQAIGGVAFRRFTKERTSWV